MARDYYSNPRSESKRKKTSGAFAILCLLISSLTIVVLITLLTTILIGGGNWIDWNFLSGVHKEDNPEQSGIGQAVLGSILICLICAMAAIPVGIGTAIFIEEFPPKNKVLRWLHGLVQLNISNLAGVPSIVYGILGLTTFVYMFGILPSIQVNSPAQYEIGGVHYYQTKTLGGTFVKFPAGDRADNSISLEQNEQAIDADGRSFELKVVQRSAAPADKEARKDYALTIKKPWYLHLPLGKSLLAAALTLALVILPIVIISSQEAIRAVPRSIREAAFGMGATRWQVVRKTVLPSALPGIMTGAILAMSRAIGEAAPVLAVMGGVLGTTTGIQSLMDQTPVLPVTIFRWAGDENAGFENASSAAIIILLVILLLMNSIAIYIRNRFENNLSS